jgi:quinolinate synthase
MDTIGALKAETGTIILAHYYQTGDVQAIADFLGDSLELARKAMTIEDASYVIFATVDFMAEVAKILNPAKTILMADTTASCPMANQLRAGTVQDYKQVYPGLPAVLYINTLAEAKAECDTICTSSNAIPVTKAIAAEWGVDRVLMGPDRHLARHVQVMTGLDIIAMPEKGCCVVHDQFGAEDVNFQRDQHPDALLIVHPECRPEVQDAADFIGSTKQMIEYMERDLDREYIVGTERGLIDHVLALHPSAMLYPLAPVPTGGICKNMKKTTVAKIQALLEIIKDGGDLAPYEIMVDPSVAEGAKRSIDAMFTYMQQ